MSVTKQRELLYCVPSTDTITKPEQGLKAAPVMQQKGPTSCLQIYLDVVVHIHILF